MKTSFVFICLLVLSFSCKPQSSQTEDTTDESAEMDASEKVIEESAEEVRRTIARSDSVMVNSLIEELKGIEKYAVRDNYYMLAAVLEKEGDSIASGKVLALLEDIFDYPRLIDVTVLDARNGYIEFYPRGTEAFVTMCYWNVSDGSKLIGTEVVGCGPVCESELSFTKYEDGVYEQLEVNEIVSDFDQLPGMLVDDYASQVDPFEFRYLLPQKGKDIRFCLEDDCAVLKWQDGGFEIQEIYE